MSTSAAKPAPHNASALGPGDPPDPSHAAASHRHARGSLPSGLYDFFVDVANMLKAFVGLNFMIVPYAFANAGLVRGVLGLLLITFITEHCCLLLVDIKESMYRRLPSDTPAPHLDDAPPSFGDVALFAGGRHVERLVNFSLILTQFGYCVGYLIFVSQTMHDVLASTVPVPWFVIFPVPILLAISLLSSIRSLGPFSVFANGALLCGFAAVVTYIANHFTWAPAKVPLTSFPLFFGQMTAALEGIGLIIPVQTSMHNRQKFPLVLRIALACLVTILLVVGIMGFATFGADTRSIILLNFGQSPVVLAVKAVLIVGILFTYPLQVIPVFEFAERLLIPNTNNTTNNSENSNFTNDPNRAQRAETDYFDDNDDTKHDDGDEDDHVSVNNGDVDIENNDGSESNSSPTAPQQPHINPQPTSVFLRDKRRIAVRVLVVLLTAVTAVLAGASFGVFQALVGSMGASVLAYTAPAWLHYLAFRDRLSRAVRFKDLAIVMFGIVGGVAGTASSLWEIVLIHRGEASPA